MVKGLNQFILNEQTVMLAIEQYINSNLKPGVNVKVTSFSLEDDAQNTFSAWVKEGKP